MHLWRKESDRYSDSPGDRGNRSRDREQPEKPQCKVERRKKDLAIPIMRRVPSRHRNAPVVRERDRGALKRFIFLLACGLVLAGGFVYAAGQHFASLRLGYETEKLRNALAQAREEQHRLT